MATNERVIVAYRIAEMYVHPQCAAEWPGEGEAIFLDEVEAHEGEWYFPGEWHGDSMGDRPIDYRCCLGCGQWLEDIENIVEARRGKAS